MSNRGRLYGYRLFYDPAHQLFQPMKSCCCLLNIQYCIFSCMALLVENFVGGVAEYAHWRRQCDDVVVTFPSMVVVVCQDNPPASTHTCICDNRLEVPVEWMLCKGVCNQTCPGDVSETCGNGKLNCYNVFQGTTAVVRVVCATIAVIKRSERGPSKRGL